VWRSRVKESCDGMSRMLPQLKAGDEGPTGSSAEDAADNLEKLFDISKPA